MLYRIARNERHPVKTILVRSVVQGLGLDTTGCRFCFKLIYKINKNMAHRQVNPEWLVSKFPKDLDAQISYMIQYGYVVQHKTDTTVTLVRKKQFSFILAILGLFLFLVGLFIYLLFYLAKSDDVIYLDVRTQKE